jgi:DNA-binding transcriptional MocR family regulator
LGQLGIRLDPRREEPLHRQIFDQVVARIESRAFPAGFKLPPSRALARELGTHRNTVARAYTELEAAGFVTAGVGRGTFVEAPQRGVPRTAAVVSADDDSRTLDMPWTRLLARGVRAEVIERAERHVRASGHRDLINLARLQPSPDLIPEQLLRRCIAHVLAHDGAAALSYAPREGSLRARQVLARDLAARGVPARAEDVLITSGSQQGLDLVARALINPGDTILVEPTTYSGAIDLFTLAGAHLTSVPCDEQGPDPEALARLARPDVKALYLMPTAHNPTGRTIGLPRRRALVEWSKRAGVALIEDDYAAGLSLDERAPPPHLRALDGDVIYLSTWSKCLAPGLRLGYLVAPARLQPTLAALKRIVDLGASLALQHTLAEFLERGYMRAHLRRVTREYRQRRDALCGALTKHMPHGVSWDVPSFGVVLWLRLPHGIDPQQVYEEALRRGVMVSPSPVWSPDPGAEAGLRLTFCAEDEERLVSGARRLAQAIKQVASRAKPDASPQPLRELV